MRLFKKIVFIVKILFNFGFKLFILNIIKYICKKNLNLYNYFCNKKHNLILSILGKKYNNLIIKYNEKYKDSYLCQPIIPKIIWLLWWDGIEKMPPIVKACYNSVLKYSNDFEVKVISKYNVSEYVSIPEHISKKLNSKLITIAHLSDILRVYLIKNYGGFWLDATVLVTNNIIFDYSYFFTIRRDYGGDNVSKRRWTGNCIAGSVNNPLFEFLNDFFYEYWKKNNLLIDYFLIDYAIALAYDNIPVINKMINNICNNNIEYLTFNSNLLNVFSIDFFNNTIKNTLFHKLYWKINKNKLLNDNQITLYDYILQQYLI